MVIEKMYYIDNGVEVIFLGIEGLINLGTSAEFLESALNSLSADGEVVIDLTKVDYVDSTGIGELVYVITEYAHLGRKLRLVAPSERVRKLLKTAKSKVRVFDTRRRFWQAFPQRP
jgi:anti-sigma B factor antagonist